MSERWKTLRRVFRLPATRRRIRDELDAELRFHLEGRIEDLMEREGLSRADAEREARRRFGDYQAYRQEARSIDDTMLDRRNRMELFDAIRRETRHAVRTLTRTPSFSLIVFVTLALGLGAATTIFTLLDRVVLRPLPYPEHDRLVHLGTLWPKSKAGQEYALAKGQYHYFRKNSTTLADLAMYDGEMAVIPGDAERSVERVSMLLASANIFTVLGIKPLYGRAFTAELESVRNPQVALISYGFWQRRFGGNPNVIGQRLPLTGWEGSFEIIGVLPPNAGPPDVKADVWTRNYLNPSDAPQNNHTHYAIGLLKPGVTVAAALADIKRVQAQMQQQYPNVYPQSFLDRSGFSMNVTSLRDFVVGPNIVRAMWLLFGAVAFVLLIAAANVANLFLVRLDARRRETAVRSALGAGRAHLAVHHLAESLLLSLVAGIGAIVLGSILLHTVLAFAPQSLPRLEEVVFDWRSVAFCLLAASAFGVVFGLVPLASSGLDIAVLRDGGRGLTSSRRRELARRGLVLTQVGLAVVLLSGALLMIKSFSRLRSVRPGFEPSGVLTLSVNLLSTQYREIPAAGAFWRELTQRIEAIPGVTRAGGVDAVPLADGFGCSGVMTDAPLPKEERGNCMPMVRFSPGYFEAMGVKVKGSIPDWSSVASGMGGVIVSEAFAKRFWRGENPIGHTVYAFNETTPPWTVVGVAEDMRGTGLQNPVVEAIYFPIVPPPGMGPGNWQARYLTVMVKAPGMSTSTLTTAVQQIVKQIDPNVLVADVQPMEQIVAKSMAQTSFTMLLLLIAAVIALSLSAVGIYGVISYVVSQRRSEIGIRMALGAHLGEVSRLVVGQSLGLAAVGVVIGVLASLAATRLLGTMLFEVSPNDPVVLVGTAIVLMFVAFIASLGPTRRAAKIDPVEAMRG
ncbi:MAG TPA: ABC transporter permease [Gemmatimonadaceae bacterium]